MKLAGKYRVRGFPTIILFKQGEEQDRQGVGLEQGPGEPEVDRHEP